MVAPDGDLGDVVDAGAGLGGQLAQSAVVVQARHGGELARVDAGRIALGDQRVGVGGVAHYQNLDAALGNGVDRLALYREDGCVGFQQILALHAGATGTGTDQQGVVGILERDFRIIGDYHARQQRERAIVQFHGNALQGAQGRGDFQHLQNDGLIGAEHLAGGNPEEKGIADLACCTGNDYTYRLFHEWDLLLAWF